MPALRIGKLIVALAVGAPKPTVVVKPLSVAVRVVAAEPCRVRACPVAPTVNALAGVIAVRAVRLVMSPLAPDAAALRLERAVVALSAPVPPLATGSRPVTSVVRSTDVPRVVSN